VKASAEVPEIDLSGEKILLLANVDWFVQSHRLAIIEAASRAGAEVTVGCLDTGVLPTFEEIPGVKTVNINITRSGTNPFQELRSLWSICRLVLHKRPTVVHTVTIKPMIYGTLAARVFSRNAKVINAISGFGYLLQSREATFPGRSVRAILVGLFRSRRVSFIVQNTGAAQRIVQSGWTSQERIHLVQGSGVDCDVFLPPERRTKPSRVRVLFASRMLWDKGIREFAEAASIVCGKVENVEFICAGPIDVGGNPTALNESDIIDLERRHPIAWIGPQSDMPTLMASADIFVLPSYHEGLPKVLIEAAASGLPLVASDIEGCRPVVMENWNGYLSRPQDSNSLAECILRLVLDDQLRCEFGSASRERAEKIFDSRKIVLEMLKVYKDV
jgi:glycosyltransferase involved in cell wall biosynthesis